MGSSSDNFDPVQKLIRLKRYEQPPPRYFANFSSQVISRIQAGEARREPAWWERFGLDLRPILTAGAGMMACGLVFFSFGFALDTDSRELGMEIGPLSPSGSPGFLSAQAEPIGQSEDSFAATSTNLLLGSSAPFVNPRRLLVTPVSYQLPQ